MQGERVIRLWPARVESVFQHRFRATNRFLRWLANKNDRAMPFVFQFSKRPRRADQRGHVNVVPARVHHRDFFALVVFGRHSARVRQTGLFVHWQRIQIAAHQHGRADAILHHADNAEAGHARLVVFADVLGDLATGGFQFLGHDCR